MVITFPIPALIITLGWLIFKGIKINRSKEGFNAKRELVHLLYFLSVLGIICLTLFPIRYGIPGHYSLSYNLVPFRSIVGLSSNSYYIVPLRNILGNILLFAPLGFIVSLKFSIIDRFYKVLLVGFFGSLVIEVIQFPLVLRAFDVDDIILNTMGTILGFILLKLSKIDSKFKNYIISSSNF